jgi:hypothetical protein
MWHATLWDLCVLHAPAVGSASTEKGGGAAYWVGLPTLPPPSGGMWGLCIILTIIFYLIYVIWTILIKWVDGQCVKYNPNANKIQLGRKIIKWKDHLMSECTVTKILYVVYLINVIMRSHVYCMNPQWGGGGMYSNLVGWRTVFCFKKIPCLDRSGVIYWVCAREVKRRRNSTLSECFVL